LLPGGESAELAGLGDGPALAGGGVLLPFYGRPVHHKVIFIAVGPHGDGNPERPRNSEP